MLKCSKNTKLFKTILCVVSTFFCVLNSSSQESYDITFEDQSMKGGICVGPNGSGIFFRNTTPFRKGYSKAYDISFTGVKTIKEKTILNQRLPNPSPYVYGKINRMYALRPMVGLTKTLAEKQSKNSIGVNGFLFGGLTFGLLKPVYVDIEVFDPNFPNNYITQSLRYQPMEMNPNRINGYSSFDKGFWETKPTLGLSFKAGADFNWGYYSSDYRSIEIGVMMDYFPGRPEIMYGIKNKTIYSSFYISFALGKNY